MAHNERKPYREIMEGTVLLEVLGDNDGRDTITDFNPEDDTLRLIGVQSMDDISVRTRGGYTYITYGDTTIILKDVEMPPEKVWERVQQ